MKRESFAVTIFQEDDIHGSVQIDATGYISPGSPATLEYPGDDPEVEIETVACYAEDDKGTEYEIPDFDYDYIAIEEAAMEDYGWSDDYYDEPDGDE
jgi:hypothetical protein